MKRSISPLILCSISLMHAEPSALSSQFLNLLVPSESVDQLDQTVANIPKQKHEQPKPESLEKNDQGIDPFLQLLVIAKNSNQKKLHRSDLESFNFKYINELEYENDDTRFPKFDEKKLNKTEKENAKKYGKRISKGYEAPWYLRYINEQIGHGAFADADIAEGEMIGEYTGIIRDGKKMNGFDMSYGWSLWSPEHYRDQKEYFHVDARKAGNFTRFINHSFYPNVKGITVYSGGEWHMVYIACRAVKKDEQLLVDYGPGYWLSKSCRPVELALED